MEEQTEETSLDTIPVGVLSKITIELDAWSLISLQNTSRRLRDLLMDQLLWEGAAVRLQLPLTDEYRTNVLQLLQQSMSTNAQHWKDHMYIAASKRGGKPDRTMQFASFLIAEEDVKKRAVQLWTDGQALALYDARGGTVISLLPPRTNLLARNQPQALPPTLQPLPSISEFTCLQHVLLQPSARCTESWPPRLLHSLQGPLPVRGSAVCLPAVTDLPASTDLAHSLLRCCSHLLPSLLLLDLSGQGLSDMELASLLSYCTRVETLRLERTQFGRMCAMTLGSKGNAITSLDLSHCPRLSSQGISMFPSIAGALNRLPNLTRLIFKGNHAHHLFSPEACQAPLPHTPLPENPVSQTPLPQDPLHLTPLQHLDLSSMTHLTAHHVASVLRICRGLQGFIVEGCKSIADGDGCTDLSRLLTSTLPHPPSLHSLSFGWGFDTLCTTHLCANSPFLTSLNLGLGCSFSSRDEAVVKVAGSCPYLRQLTLSFCVVSDPGVSAVLRHCPQLQVLRLLQCTGPFSNAMVQDVPDSGRWGLREFQLVGGRALLSDACLGRIIGRRKPCLETLALVGPRGLTNRTLGALLSSHTATLQHLRLEECYDPVPGDTADTWLYNPPTHPPAHQGTHPCCPPPGTANGSTSVRSTGTGTNTGTGTADAGSSGVGDRSAMLNGSSAADRTSTPGSCSKGGVSGHAGGGEGGGSDAGGGRPALERSFHHLVLMPVLKKCQQLRSLRLRHACMVPFDVVKQLKGSCPLLSSLVLDQCDLAEGGLELEGDPHAALQHVQVCKCRQCPVSEGRLDRDVVVHVLSEGRSIPLKCFKHLD